MGGVWVRISRHPYPQIICECEWETDGERPRQPAGSSRLPVFHPAPSPPTSTQMDTDPLETWRPAATPSQGPPLCPPFSSQPLLGREGCLERKKGSLHEVLYYDLHIKLQIHSRRVEELIYQLLLSQKFWLTFCRRTRTLWLDIAQLSLQSLKTKFYFHHYQNT